MSRMCHHCFQLIVLQLAASSEFLDACPHFLILSIFFRMWLVVPIRNMQRRRATNHRRLLAAFMVVLKIETSLGLETPSTWFAVHRHARWSSTVPLACGWRLLAAFFHGSLRLCSTLTPALGWRPLVACTVALKVGRRIENSFVSWFLWLCSTLTPALGWRLLAASMVVLYSDTSLSLGTPGIFSSFFRGSVQDRHQPGAGDA